MQRDSTDLYSTLLYYLCRHKFLHVFTIDTIRNLMQSVLPIIRKVGLCCHSINPLETEYNLNYI